MCFIWDFCRVTALSLVRNSFLKMICHSFNVQDIMHQKYLWYRLLGIGEWVSGLQ